MGIDAERRDAVRQAAAENRKLWDASSYHIHKRPPFAVTMFDTTDRYWVVGSTGVSVIGIGMGDPEAARLWANALNGGN